MKKIKVGLLFTPLKGFTKFFEPMEFFDLILKDERFEVSFLYIKRDFIPDDFWNKYKPLWKRFTIMDIRNSRKQDYIYIIRPYFKPNVHFEYWESKIIYKQYGTSGMVPNCDNFTEMYSPIFNNSYRIITDTTYFKGVMEEHGVDGNKILVGNPLFDYTKKLKRHEHERPIVLYTPHHSIFHVDELDGQFSTFLTYADLFVYEIPLMFPEIDFRIKCHPLLENKINKMNRRYADESDYIPFNFKEWKEAVLENPNVTFLDDQNDDIYQEFVDSDAIINDSLSFTLSYLPTLKPMCVPYDEHRSAFTQWGNKLVDSCWYKAFNKYDIFEFLENVIKKKDSKLESRKLFSKCIQTEKANSEKLRDFLLFDYAHNPNEITKKRALMIPKPKNRSLINKFKQEKRNGNFRRI